MSTAGEWTRVTPQHPCPHCDRSDERCAVSEDGRQRICYRVGGAGAKEKRDKAGVLYYVHPVNPTANGNGRAHPNGNGHANGNGKLLKPLGKVPGLADPARLDEVYRALLDHPGLALSPANKVDLERRGFPEGEADRLCYRSMPHRRREDIAAEMAKRFGRDVLLHVPGFFIDARGSLSITCLPGLLIPARDARGRIAALIIRPNQKLDDGSKFRWVSSKTKGGPSPGAPPHVPLGIRRPARAVRLTEGQLKADLATILSGIPTVGAPGVGNWRCCVPVLKDLGARTVRLAFDADWRRKPKDVARPLLECGRALVGEGFALELELWPEAHGKGIDDLLAAGKTAEVLAGKTALAALAEVAGVVAPPRCSGPDDQPADAEGDPRTIIDLTADLHVAVDLAAAAVSMHEEVFQRVHQLVRVVRHRAEKVKPKEVRREDGAPLIAPFAVASARTIISRVARFRRWDKRAKEWEWKTPPRDIVESILEARDYPEARELAGIIEAPTLRPDGSLLDKPGYDPETGLLLLPNGTYPPIPDRPSKAKVEAAKRSLLYLVRDFPFKSPCDEAAWLASVLTLVCRGAIDGPVPAYLVSANLAGAGKTRLAALAGLIAGGRVPAMDGYASDPAEMEKTLVGLGQAGDRCIVFDNAPNGSAIGSAPLDRAILARRSFRGRLLGRNAQSPDVPWCAVVFVTGNNLCTRDDSLRRFLPIFLEYPEEHPESRDPKQYQVFRDHGLDLDRYVLRERPHLVAAALTLVRGYLAAGAPQAQLTPLDFPEWERLVRQAVYHATGADPYGSHAELEADDETAGDRLRVVNAWAALCKAAERPNGLTTDEAAEWLEEHAADANERPLIITFQRWAKRGQLPDAKALGYLLRKHRNTGTPSGKLRCHDENVAARRWFVR
jgi:Domain of unknown function (DUF3854)